VETILCMSRHHCSAQELATLLKTDQNRSLNSFEVRHKQVRFVPNALTVRNRII